jgi:hypothetical protein
VLTQVLKGRPSLDVTRMNADRFQPYHMTPRFRAERVVESLGKVGARPPQRRPFPADARVPRQHRPPL